MRIGILSDTHAPRGLDHLGPELAAFLSSVDRILHTGDVDDPRLLDWLEQFAPVICARGNHDMFEDERMVDVVLIEAEGWTIGAKHQVDEPTDTLESVHKIKRDSFGGTAVDVLIAGDTHFERVEYLHSTMFLNSGSATLPHNYSTRLGGVALLEVTAERVRAELIRLGETPGLRNPSRVGHVAFGRAGVIDAAFDGVPADAQPHEVRWPE